MGFRANHIEMVKAALSKKPWAITGTQYIISGFKWVIPGEIWNAEPDIEMSEYGFKNSTKMSQLMRNYYNPEEIQKANAQVLDRMRANEEYTSTAWSMVGKEKKGSRQGHCIRTGTVSFLRMRRGEPKFNVIGDFTNRMVELSRRFPTDFLLIRNRVLPAVLKDAEYEIKKVRFNFNVAAVHVHMILPMMTRDVDFVGFADEIKEICPAFHRMIIMHLARMFRMRANPENYSYYSSMQRPLDEFLNRVKQGNPPMKVVGDYFEENKYLLNVRKGKI